jgi:hypothetical protein
MEALVGRVWQRMYERCYADIRGFLEAGDGNTSYGIEQLKIQFAPRAELETLPDKADRAGPRHEGWAVEAVCDQLIREGWPVRRRDQAKTDTNSQALELMSVRKR